MRSVNRTINYTQSQAIHLLNEHSTSHRSGRGGGGRWGISELLFHTKPMSLPLYIISSLHSLYWLQEEASSKLKTPVAIPERLPKLSSGSSVVSDVSANNTTAAVERSETPASTTTTTTTITTNTPDVQSISYLAHTPSFNCHMCTAKYSSYNKLRGKCYIILYNIGVSILSLLLIINTNY